MDWTVLLLTNFVLCGHGVSGLDALFGVIHPTSGPRLVNDTEFLYVGPQSQGAELSIYCEVDPRANLWQYCIWYLDEELQCEIGESSSTCQNSGYETQYPEYCIFKTSGLVEEQKYDCWLLHFANGTDDRADRTIKAVKTPSINVQQASFTVDVGEVVAVNCVSNSGFPAYTLQLISGSTVLASTPSTCTSQSCSANVTYSYQPSDTETLYCRSRSEDAFGYEVISPSVSISIEVNGGGSKNGSSAGMTTGGIIGLSIFVILLILLLIILLIYCCRKKKEKKAAKTRTPQPGPMPMPGPQPRTSPPAQKTTTEIILQPQIGSRRSRRRPSTSSSSSGVTDVGWSSGESDKKSTSSHSPPPVNRKNKPPPALPPKPIEPKTTPTPSSSFQQQIKPQEYPTYLAKPYHGQPPQRQPRPVHYPQHLAPLHKPVPRHPPINYDSRKTAYDRQNPQLLSARDEPLHYQWEGFGEGSTAGTLSRVATPIQDDYIDFALLAQSNGEPFKQIAKIAQDESSSGSEDTASISSQQFGLGSLTSVSEQSSLTSVSEVVAPEPEPEPKPKLHLEPEPKPKLHLDRIDSSSTSSSSTSGDEEININSDIQVTRREEPQTEEEVKRDNDVISSSSSDSERTLQERVPSAASASSTPSRARTTSTPSVLSNLSRGSTGSPPPLPPRPESRSDSSQSDQVRDDQSEISSTSSISTSDASVLSSLPNDDDEGDETIV